MKSPLDWITRPEAGHVVLAAAVAVAAGYQVQRPIEVSAGSPLLSRCFRNFWGEEGGYRWSQAASTLVIPDPGPGLAARLELQVSGWRPRGEGTPYLNLTAGPAGLTARPAPGGETLSFDVVTGGWWSSDLELGIDSPTFSPGAQDRRALGMRIYGARLVPAGGLLALHQPPMRQVAFVCAALFLLCGLLIRLGAPVGTARAASIGAALAIGVGFAVARPYVALASFPILLLMAALTLLAHLAPQPASVAGRVLAESSRLLGRGARQLPAHGLVVLILGGAFGVARAYRTQRTIEIDVGSGREDAVASGFGPFDAFAGATFRAASRGAQLDLRDFGSGSWTIDVTASIDSPTPRRVDLLRVGKNGILVMLQDRWLTAPLVAEAPRGWHAGLLLAFPGGDSPKLRIDKVKIDRLRAWPPLRIVAAVVGLSLLFGAGLGAVGLSRWAALAAMAVIELAIVLALQLDPAVAIPFVIPFLGIVAAGTLLLALLAGARAVAESHGFAGLPRGPALAAAGLGFMAWLAATAFPLYRGGNFVFHSSISEEIWKGRFLIYYLPYPGSMLSRQAQWGNIIVPHPCLEQTVLAPLAALPQPWFYIFEKGVLALWLASLVILAALIAGRVAGPRAAPWAAAMTVCLVPTFQLLGLGHLMTLFGCWASSLALTFLLFRLDRLGERKVWWTAVGLLALSFLSYFASLLFGGLVLVLLLPWLWRREPVVARRLLAAAVTAGVLAFLLYYVHWAGPFLSQSVPAIASGSSRSAEAATPLLSRLALQPHKLAYSYGSALVPLVGLAGLAWLTRGRDRGLLLIWSAVLVLVCGLDLKFNFLLKHHYFVMVPIAVGCGLVLAWLFERGSAGRLAAVALLTLAGALAFTTGLAVALGQIP